MGHLLETQHGPPADFRRAERLRALGHPARLAILRALAARGRCVCGELVEAMPLAQSTVSQHLKVLKEAGLIRGTVEGPRSCYCIDTETMAALAGDLAELFETLARRAEPCRARPEAQATEARR